MPGFGATVFSAIGLGATLPPPLGPLVVASFKCRIPGGVSVQVFYPANAESERFKSADKQRRLAYSEGFIAGTAYATKTPLGLWSCVLGNCKHVAVADLVPETVGDIQGNQSYPLMVFSHGLMGSSDSYTKTCADIASHGFIVVAVDHEDGSASFARTEKGEVLQYHFPPPPPQPREVVMAFRAPFLDKRKVETEQVLTTFAEDVHGEVKELSAIRNRIDKTRIILGGHSFGAASTVNFLRSHPSRAKCAVLLDIWPFPMELETGLQGVPVFLLQSEEFVRNEEALITAQFLKNCDQLWASTYIEGSTHRSMSDTTFWLPYGLAKKAKLCGETRPEVTQKVMIEAIILFLKKRVIENQNAALEEFEQELIKASETYLKQFRGLVGDGVRKVRG